MEILLELQSLKLRLDSDFFIVSTCRGLRAGPLPEETSCGCLRGTGRPDRGVWRTKLKTMFASGAQIPSWMANPSFSIFQFFFLFCLSLCILLVRASECSHKSSASIRSSLGLSLEL